MLAMNFVSFLKATKKSQAVTAVVTSYCERGIRQALATTRLLLSAVGGLECFTLADEPSFVVEVEDNFLTDKARADWAKNTWGWRFRKIKDGRWEEVLKNARDILLTVCKQSLS